MSKTKMSSQSQYQYSDWNLTKLKGMLDALYYQDIITEATHTVMLNILKSHLIVSITTNLNLW